MYKLILLAALVAVAFASGKPAEYPEDPAAAEDQVRDILAYKQHEVNKQALYHGAGVGTAPYRGVPGTSLERNPGYYNYGFHPYGGAHYGYGAGYGYGAAYGAYPYGAYARYPH